MTFCKNQRFFNKNPWFFFSKTPWKSQFLFNILSNLKIVIFQKTTVKCRRVKPTFWRQRCMTSAPTPPLSHKFPLNWTIRSCRIAWPAPWNGRSQWTLCCRTHCGVKRSTTKQGPGDAYRRVLCVSMHVSACGRLSTERMLIKWIFSPVLCPDEGNQHCATLQQLSTFEDQPQHRAGD